MTKARYIVEAWASCPLPIARSQSPKWHINIIARECGLRLRRVWQSLRIFCIARKPFCDCQTHKGCRILIFSSLFSSFSFSFFHFRCPVHALNFHSALSILKGVWKCREKNGKVRNSLTFISPIASWTRAKKKYNYKEAKRRKKGTKCDVNM